MKLMKEHGTFYVPTLSAGRWVYDQAQDPDFFPPIVRPKALRSGPADPGRSRKAYKAGVKIMFGTDTGVSKHGDNAREFQLMVEGGMPADGSHHARRPACRRSSWSSTTGPAASPSASSVSWWACRAIRSTDISVMERVVFVMKDDTVYKAP